MTLQDKLDMLRMQGVPLPLVGMEETLQAMRLRKVGLPYSAIATTMRVYHGSTRSERSWRRKLRFCGAAPKHYANSLRVPPQLQERVS